MFVCRTTQCKILLVDMMNVAVGLNTRLFQSNSVVLKKSARDIDMENKACVFTVLTFGTGASKGLLQQADYLCASSFF